MNSHKSIEDLWIVLNLKQKCGRSFIYRRPVEGLLSIKTRGRFKQKHEIKKNVQIKKMRNKFAIFFKILLIPKFLSTKNAKPKLDIWVHSV